MPLWTQKRTQAATHCREDLVTGKRCPSAIQVRAEKPLTQSLWVHFCDLPVRRWECSLSGVCRLSISEKLIETWRTSNNSQGVCCENGKRQKSLENTQVSTRRKKAAEKTQGFPKSVHFSLKFPYEGSQGLVYRFLAALTNLSQES